MVISIKNLNKDIGNHQILKDINLSIPSGKITSFIGPNGAGKSTLLNIIARLNQASSGTVEVNGVDVHKTASLEVSKLLAILKQSNHIALRLTVFDLVAFGRFPYTQGKLKQEDYEIINKSIDYMGLTDMKFKFLDELSGGQRQRAYISRLLAQDTEYVFLDEPLNNLDMKHSVQIMKVLRDLCDNHGKTIIVVLHDINFASAYSDEIVALKDGQVAYQGEVSTIMNYQVLKDLYDVDIPIVEINGNYIASYFK